LFSRIVTDWFYRIPAIRLAEAYASRRAGSAHLYEFAWQPATFDQRIGACHASELPFVFDNLHDKSFTALLGPNPPQQIADTMHSAWVAFATTGDPGWPPYDAATRSTMRFDTNSKVIEDPQARERALWDGHR
jgi:para-nitrobenzyl esterase